MVVRMDFDLAEACAAVAAGKVDQIRPAWKDGAGVCVVMASGGYPGDFQTGKRIDGLAEAGAVADSVVFHAGTRLEGSIYYTGSGRVLGVTAFGSDLEASRRACYEAVSKIRFENAHYRTDIGAQGVSRIRAAGD